METSGDHRLTYLPHAGIDFRKWDRCVEQSPCSRVYALSWYLNLTAGVWDGLVEGDYRHVMPLPVRKKYSFTYLYQPFFTQQLGIFPPASPALRTAFAAELEKRFRYMDYQATGSCDFLLFGSFRITPRSNRVLPLTGPYETLAAGFSGNTRRNLRDAGKQGLVTGLPVTPEEYLHMKREAAGKEVPRDSYTLLHKLMAESLARGYGEILAARNREGVPVSAAFLLHWGNRIYYLNAFSTAEGKTMKAAFAIAAQIIRTHASTGKILDFEGSDIPGVDRFYAGFGALREPYLRIGFNRLPGILKRLKQQP